MDAVVVLGCLYCREGKGRVGEHVLLNVDFRFVPQQALAVVASDNVDIDLAAKTSFYTHLNQALWALL